MKSFVLLAFLNVGGVDYPQETRFFDNQKQCQDRADMYVSHVSNISSLALPLKSGAKCHKISPEVAAEE
jgi:hypothetical protein